MAARTVARAAVRGRVLDATLADRTGATGSPTCLADRREGVIPSAGLERWRVFSDRVLFCARSDKRLPRAGRATAAAAAPAGAVPRKTSSAGVASTGAGSTAAGAGC